MNAAMSGTGHGAAPSALGYAYQAEVALVELVRRAKVEPATDGNPISARWASSAS